MLDSLRVMSSQSHVVTNVIAPTFDCDGIMFFEQFQKNSFRFNAPCFLSQQLAFVQSGGMFNIAV